MKRNQSHLAERLRPEVVYGILEVQNMLGIPFEDLIRAAGDAQIARFLGEGRRMHFIGADLQDWLCGRKPWPNPLSESRRQADTVGHRCRRPVSVISHKRPALSDIRDDDTDETDPLPPVGSF